VVPRKVIPTTEVDDQFRLLVSTVVDYAIFMLDPTGHIATWNEGAERIKGYSADEIIGRHFSVFYPADQVQIRKPDWELEVARRDGRYEEEGWRVRKDGLRFWAHVVITAMRDETGRLRGFGKVTRDLTEKRMQDEARNAERDREEALLRAHAERMADLERTKTHFLNVASHELRGPLTVLRGYNSLLEEEAIPVQQIPAVARLLATKLAEMDRLVEQMLETARLEQDMFDMLQERFDLADVVQEQLDVFRPISPNHRFIFDADGRPALVKGDRARVATIVSNLMDNAVKYSPVGGDVRCSVRSLGSQVFWLCRRPLKQQKTTGKRE
jgi:PAS domain S-box-containing protein